MAYTKKIPVDLDCPLRLTMSLIDSKWKSCILDELRSGEPLRPSEIHKRLPEAASRVLDIQLKELVDDGLIEKTIFPELPPRSEYRISSLGEANRLFLFQTADEIRSTSGKSGRQEGMRQMG